MDTYGFFLNLFNTFNTIICYNMFIYFYSIYMFLLYPSFECVYPSLAASFQQCVVVVCHFAPGTAPGVGKESKDDRAEATGTFTPSLRSAQVYEMSVTGFVEAFCFWKSSEVRCINI